MPGKKFMAPLYVECSGHLVAPRCSHGLYHADAATGKVTIDSVNSSCSICTSRDLESVMKMLQPPKRDSKLPDPLPELEDEENTDGEENNPVNIDPESGDLEESGDSDGQEDRPEREDEPDPNDGDE